MCTRDNSSIVVESTVERSYLTPLQPFHNHLGFNYVMNELSLQKALLNIGMLRVFIPTQKLLPLLLIRYIAALMLIKSYVSKHDSSRWLLTLVKQNFHGSNGFL